MTGYTPVFSEIYLGTLFGRWPAAAVWASLLPLCDKDGTIDMHPSAIAGMTGWPLDLLLQGIAQLCETDEHSRTTDHEGKRLIPLDPSRPWGWKVVNHSKYREKARLLGKRAAEVESGKNAARMRDRRRPPETAADRPSDSDADTNKDKKGADAPVVDGLDQKAWETWVSYRKTVGKSLNPKTYQTAQKKMAALGGAQMAAVENSIANNYQGLFAPNGTPAKALPLTTNGLPKVFGGSV